MTTLRLQIVDAIADALAAAIPTAKHYRNIDYALEAQKLPAIAVQEQENAPDGQEGPLTKLYQYVEIEFHILIARSSTPAKDADPYEALIHRTLMPATSFASQPVRIECLPASWEFNLGDCAARTLRYRVRYSTSLADLEAS